MKKENKCGIRRVLVILLCFMLVTSNTGTVAFAGESAPAQTDAEEVISGTESSESAVESDELTLKNDSAEESAEESFDEGTKEEGTKSEESSVEEPEAEGSAEQEPTAEEFNAEESVEREPTAVESAEEGYETEEPAKEGYEAEGPAKEEDAAEEPQDVLEESAEALTKTVDASMSEEPAGEQDGNSGVIASGTCGADSDNLTWVLTDDGTMTISGEGAMENYSENSCPWSSYRSSITNVVIPFGITNIGNYAFSDCTNLTSATIPESVTCIGDFAFAGCTSLKTAPITDSVTEIGEKAFTECNSLTSVTIPGSMEKNGGYVFSDCKGLTSAMIETGITNIAAGMFYGCEKMICVMIPDTVTYIRRFAFFGCPLIIDVYYNGTAWQWSRIGIDDIGNDILVNGIEDNSITIHYVSKVPYVENSWNGTAVVSKSRYAFADSVPSDGNMTSGWYYLNSDVTKNGRIESIFGDVRLILGDGNTLDVKGLYVPEGSTLTIYGQTDGSGRIYSHPSGGAGIGGYSGHNNGKIEIHGGTIDATGYDHCAGIGSNDGKTTGDITIYDGTITAIGGSDGAGIGGGLNCSGGNITIYGGTITANGPTDDDCCENGAGIGGGKGGDGGNITIYGGSITTYSRDGAGIGGGDDGDGGNITISGGTITSTKVNQGQGARIGGGCDAAPGTITINGGTITTDGGSGAGIGGGKRNTAGGSVTINGGVISASGSYGIGNGENGSDVAITLNYTDSTRNSISITASSYFGNVTLEQHFQNMDYIFEQSSDPDLGFLAHSALRAWDGRISSWALLRKRINAGGEISLGQDYTAEENDTALTVPPGREVTLDLNGYTLDRDLSDGEAKEDGYVLRNEGKLTIIDSAGGGVITGGNCKDDGGGIYNKGTLALDGVKISGNRSEKQGGGIYNEGTLNVSGAIVVSDNEAADGSNIYLADGHTTITVTGELTEGAELHVMRNGGVGVITSDYSKYNAKKSPELYFYSDNPDFIVLPDTGEAEFYFANEIIDSVPYVERSWGGTAVTEKTLYADKVRPASIGLTTGWYYLNSNVTVNGRVNLTGDTYLILGDGYTLNVKGLYIPKGNTLTIYAQSKDSGTLISKPDKGGAGIGATSDNHPGGDIFIHGGTVTAVGDDHCAGIGSNDGNGTTSNITIYGGTITATGGSNGAGIGGGRYCDAGGIQIYSGTVTATGKGNSAGIGGGDPGSGSNGNGGVILITGGTVTATGSGKGAGIGGSQKGSAQVYIEGGVINAGSGSGGVGIGHGADCTSVGDDDGIYLSWSSVSKNTISIAASSFKGEVKLDDPFCNDAYAFGAGTYTDNTQLSQLADSPLTAWDETVRNWAELQRFINISRDGIETKIKLAADIIATETDSCLNVPAGKMIDIDLDGFTIDRNLGSLTEGVSGGGVFHVKSNAYLTIHDESSEKTGTVRGGRNSGNGGGIYNEGTLYIEGCTITDCQSSENGGGIYSKGTLTISKGTITECVAIEDGGGVCNGGTYTDGKDCKVTMESGTITNNTSRAGGGVCNYYGELVITGGTISGNKVELSGGGIYLYYGTADISGGLITDNGTTKGAGGGIFLFYSTLTLSGGSVSKNYAAESGGGIRVLNLSPGAADDPKLLIKGHPEVSDNTVNGAANNIDMDNMQLIKVVGKLDEDVVLGVILQNKSGNCSGVITTGLDGNGTEANFRSDDSKYQVKLNVDGEAELVEMPVVTINGVSGSFNDKIRLNYYFDFPDSVLDDEGAYVTLARKNEENPKKLLIKNAEKVPDKGYKFSIELVAKEASDTITARVYDSQDNRLTIIGDLKRGDYTETGVQYTLMEYFNWLSTSGETDKEKAVGAAAKDYCSAAQLYFKYNTKDVTVSSAVDAVTEKTLESYVASRSGTLPTGVSIKGISAMLESDNTLRLYLDFKNVDPAAFQYYIGEIKEDNKVELIQRSDKMYYLALDTGVFSNHLQDTHKYSVSDGTNTYTITASVLTYARSCALKSNKAESNLGKALYLYNQAAVEAFGN